MSHADTLMARYLTKRIDELSKVKTQRQIAAEIGYDKPNMISMFKRGESKVPLDKIPALAMALNVDPAHLFRLAMEQQWPGMKSTVHEIFKNIASENEAEILLKPWREWTKDRDPSPTARAAEILERAFKEIMGVAPEATGR
ncbi:XRE family transcriptional regulator [Rhodoblastus acidophilus]|nr:XRE family transcriptional regulator [Rhodoblastus acidophilus]RAI21523.1 XRE family transcriptional regulator [Rhodoblastus acidophilus]